MHSNRPVDGSDGKKTAQNDQYLNSLNGWKNNAPLGEDRTKVAEQMGLKYEVKASRLFIRDTDITELPPIPPKVIELEIHEWSRLKTLSGDLSQLEKLDILDCDNLTKVSANLTSLKDLGIYRCSKVEDVKFIEGSHSLEYLKLRALDSLKEFKVNLPLLIDLGMHDCKNLTQFQCNLSIKNLFNVQIEKCGDISCLSWNRRAENFNQNNSQQTNELMQRGIILQQG